MTRLCICDIDGVIVNSVKRFEQATHEGKINWDEALNSNALHLDELMPNAAEDLRAISESCNKTVLLTSRYDHMRQASLTWLDQHNITTYDQAIFKPWDDRYTKTKIWKAQQVIKLLREGAQPSLWQAMPVPIAELLIVEDEEANREAIQQDVARWILSHKQMRARYFVSLQEAVQYEKDVAMLPPVIDDIPF